DIASDANALMEDYIGNDDLRGRLQQIVDNINRIRQGLQQCAQGPRTILGASEVQDERDPVIGGTEILVADDEPNIRTTIRDILRKCGANVTLATNGTEAIAFL